MSAIIGGSLAFSELLKHWRGFRRLSQMDLALNADVSQRHVSFLESGRSKPSREMVVQLAESLQLPLRERNRLLNAAGYAPIYGETSLNDEELAPVRQALDLMLQHHEPYPAVVVNAHWDLLQANAAMLRLLQLVGDPAAMWQKVCPDQVPNIFKLSFHPQGLRPFISNFEEIAPLMINRSFRETHDHPKLLDLLEEVLNYPDIPSRWRTPDFTSHLPPVLTMDLHAGEHALRLFSTITTFGTAQDVTTDELRVESFFPADESSKQLLMALQDQI